MCVGKSVRFGVRPEFESYPHLFVTSGDLFSLFKPPSLGREAIMSSPRGVVTMKRENIGESSQLWMKP